MRYGDQATDIDAFDISMDVDVAVGNRAQGYGPYGKTMPVGSAYNNHGHPLDHQHHHGHIGHDSKHSHAYAHDVHSVQTQSHGDGLNGGSDFIHGTIQPFSRPQHSIVTRFLTELRSVLREHHAKKVVILAALGVLCILVMLLWCQTTNSIALTAFTYIILFDVLSLAVCLITIWVAKQRPSSVYTYGYERFEVLAVFSTTMLAIFGAIFIMKESTERFVQPPEIHTGRLMLGAILGLFAHLLLIYGARNRAFSHVSTASKTSWLQEHFADICKSFCTIVPGLDHILLPRVNPFVLIGLGSMLSLCVTDFLIDINNFHQADPLAAFCIAMMTIGTMFPMSVYSGTILLQTTPAHILGQLDKSLREASTLDGVLEFRNEHFWTLSFGQLAGSLNVRVRRDADEQMVLAHVFNKLSHLVSTLTIQIIKDEWTRFTPVSSAIGTKRTALDDFKPGPATPASQYKHVASAIPGYMTNNSVYRSQGSAPVTPVRAHSTPFGTPLRDVSFTSDLDSVPSNDVPSPVLPESKVKGILRTNAGSGYGAPRHGSQYERPEFAPYHPTPLNTGNAVIDFRTLGTTDASSTNTMMGINTRTNVRR